MAKCLECGKQVAKSKRGQPRRFCATECKNAFNSRALARGVHAYHLLRIIRRERATAKRLNLWTELCRLELAWEDEDRKADRVMPSYKPAEMILADLAELTRAQPKSPIYVKERMPA